MWTSICCTVLAIGSVVVVDLGQPMRLWELFIYSNLGSPLMWGHRCPRHVPDLVHRLPLGSASGGEGKAFPCSASCHQRYRACAPCWFIPLPRGSSAFSRLVELWHTALSGPLVVSSALVCGTALVLVVIIALRKAGLPDVEQANIVKLAKMLGAFVCVDLYFFGCDL